MMLRSSCAMTSYDAVDNFRCEKDSKKDPKKKAGADGVQYQCSIGRIFVL